MSPFYLYKCPGCDGEFEEEHRMGQAPSMVDCPNCQAQSRRVLIVPRVHFKARGFTGAGRAGGGRVDHFRHRDGSKLTESEKSRKAEISG